MDNPLQSIIESEDTVDNSPSSVDTKNLYVALAKEYNNKLEDLSIAFQDELDGLISQGMEEYSKGDISSAKLATKYLSEGSKLERTIDSEFYIINALGGIEVTIKDNQVKYVPVSSAGTQVLNGKQALAYSRIRKTGHGDYERTERQRSVLEQIMNKGINAGVMNYPKLLNTILPYVETSLSKSEILKLGTSSFNSHVKTLKNLEFQQMNMGKVR